MVKKETANSKLVKTINEATNSHLTDERHSQNFVQIIELDVNFQSTLQE